MVVSYQFFTFFHKFFKRFPLLSFFQLVTKFWSVPYCTVKIRIRKPFFLDFKQNRLDKLASKMLNVNKKENSHENIRSLKKKKSFNWYKKYCKKWKNQSLVRKNIKKDIEKIVQPPLVGVFWPPGLLFFSTGGCPLHDLFCFFFHLEISRGLGGS